MGPPPRRRDEFIPASNSRFADLSQAKIVRAFTGWFLIHARDLPWRRTRDPYAIWVSEVMLQQTQVKTVVPYWTRWMHALPDVVALARADTGQVLKLWEGLGYYRRARNLQGAARLIVQQHQGRFPEDYESVLALPGVGRYTAGAICSLAFNQPRPILDGNVIRVLARLYGLTENVKTPETNRSLWALSEQLVKVAHSLVHDGMKLRRRGDLPCSRHPAPPISTASRATRGGQGLVTPAAAARREFDPALGPGASSPAVFNQSMMELGALVCTPREPKCNACPVARWCAGRKQGALGAIPNLGPRQAMTQRRFAAFILRRDGRFLVRQRPESGVNRHLWEFPNEELAGVGETGPTAGARLFGTAPENIVLAGRLLHSITTNHITLEVFAVEEFSPDAAGSQGVWLTQRQMAKLPFTAAHKKIRLRYAPRTSSK